MTMLIELIITEGNEGFFFGREFEKEKLKNQSEAEFLDVVQRMAKLAHAKLKKKT